MADRCILPAKMGGHECEIVQVWGVNDSSGLEICNVRYEVDGHVILADLPMKLLTPVKPPPDDDEPRYDAQALIDAFVAAKLAGQRIDGDYQYAFRSNEEAAEQAWRVADRFFSPLLAKADPFAEPVQLPWQLEGTTVELHGRAVLVKHRIDGADIGDEPSYFQYVYLPQAARDVCRAVWAAANQAEAGTEDHE